MCVEFHEVRRWHRSMRYRLVILKLQHGKAVLLIIIQPFTGSIDSCYLLHFQRKNTAQFACLCKVQQCRQKQDVSRELKGFCVP